MLHGDPGPSLGIIYLLYHQTSLNGLYTAKLQGCIVLINCRSKDDDITWLYGPLQPRTTELYAEKQEIIQIGELTKGEATVEAEKGGQYETVYEQLGLDAAMTQMSRQTSRQVGNLKHGRRPGKSFARNISIQAKGEHL